MGRRVAIIGASTDRAKFGNKAVRAFASRGDEVFPIHPTAVSVEGHAAYQSVLDVPGALDMVSFYVPPAVGLRVIEDVARKGVGEVWLNPGSESEALIARVRALGLVCVVACSISGVGLSPASLS